MTAFMATGVSALERTASSPVPGTPAGPTVAATVATRPPEGLPAAMYLDAVARGAVIVDIRTHRQRSAAGALPGALAIEAALVETRLDPASPGRLAISGGPDVEWVLVSADGTLASMAARALQAMGVRGVDYVSGGFDALERHRMVTAGSAATHVRREGAAISSH